MSARDLMRGSFDMSEPMPFSGCCFFIPSNWCRCFFRIAAFTWRAVRRERNVLLHLVFFVTGKSTTVDHVVEGDVGDLLQAAGGHVQADRPVQEEGAQLEEGVEGEGRHVWLAPTVAPLLNIFLKLHPSKKRNYQ